MKKFLYIFLCLLAACSKKDMVTPDTSAGMNTVTETIDYSKQKLLFEGSFSSGVHTTSGKALIYEDIAGKKTLVFENFKTDAGPDLRIYIANDKALTNFIEVNPKVENGNKAYILPTKADPNQQKFVLIWCKQFAVLFGHAELK